MSLGAAGDLVRRLKALQSETRPTPAADAEDDDDEDPPPRPVLTVVGTGVSTRG